MPKAIGEWEKDLSARLSQISTEDRKKAGGFLPVIPCRQEWDDFIIAVRFAWPNIQNYDVRPCCLLTLLTGVAFYEYDEKKYWPNLQRLLGLKELPPLTRSRICDSYKHQARSQGFTFCERSSGNDFVGTSVYLAGIPISYWSDFLRLCEWAVQCPEWQMFDEQTWASKIKLILPNLTRLQRFFKDNRDCATTCIAELIQARSVCQQKPELELDELTRTSFLLRKEFFDEVPETADFLRPQDPESLLKNRARLVWDEKRSTLSIHLPPVQRESLPATWRVGSIQQPASGTSDEIAVDSQALVDPVKVTLRTAKEEITQRLQGLADWGLFDLEQHGKIVNTDRQPLPLRSYSLLSKTKIDPLGICGFEETEASLSDLVQLNDGSNLYISKLWPIGGGNAEYKFRFGINQEAQLSFRPQRRIETRFYVGTGIFAAAYDSQQIEEWVRLEQLPILSLQIPLGYWIDPLLTLTNDFQVLIDDRKANGSWCKAYEDSDCEFFFWSWANSPLNDRRQNRTFRSFSEIDRRVFSNPNSILAPGTIHWLSISSPRYQIKTEYRIELQSSMSDFGDCWKAMPGSYLLWFLLDQPFGNTSWDDLLVAKSIIANNRQFSGRLLHQYARQGYLQQQGRQWKIRISKAVFTGTDILFCGKPSLLWALCRYIHSQIRGGKMPGVEIQESRENLPYIRISCESQILQRAREYLSRRTDLVIVDNLWGDE